MDRCVVVTVDHDRWLMAQRLAQHSEAPERLDEWAKLCCERELPTWTCGLIFGVKGHLVQDWWLLILQSEKCEIELTVLQSLSASPNEAGLAGLLAARVAFLLHVLQRRGVFQSALSKHRIVQIVNQQLLRAMEDMPVLEDMAPVFGGSK